MGTESASSRISGEQAAFREFGQKLTFPLAGYCEFSVPVLAKSPDIAIFQVDRCVVSG